MPKPPSPLFLLIGILTLLLAAGTVYFWQHGKRPLRDFFVLGTVGWIISFSLERAWFGITREPVFFAVDAFLGEGKGDWLLWLYPGLVAGGVHAVLLRLLADRTRLREADWHQAVAFAIGYGAIKTVVWGALSLLGFVHLTLFFHTLEAPVQKIVAQEFGRNYGLIPLQTLDYAMTLVIHAFIGLLVLCSVQRKQARWFWAALIYSSAIHALALWLSDKLGTRMAPPARELALFELLIAGFAVLAGVGIRKLQPLFREPEPLPEETEEKAESELLELVTSA